MNGILVVDKPEGLTSFDVVRRARRWCKTRRVGHAGTLDPFATGVLPVAIGQSTRLVEYLMSGDKEYLATLQLGVSTDTQDLHGQVLERRDWQQITRAQLEALLPRFTGTIMQVPPMYSALKQNGQPLYRLARQGLEVERQAREVRIDNLELQSFEPPQATLLVGCGKGTYVRTLAHDLGELLGCGAHLTALRRTRCGCFDLTDATSVSALQDLAEQGESLPLLSPAQALADWPMIAVDGDVCERLLHGVAPALGELALSAEPCAGSHVGFLAGDRLVAVARFTPNGFGKRPKDFEILKVFPEVSADG